MEGVESASTHSEHVRKGYNHHYSILENPQFNHPLLDFLIDFSIVAALILSVAVIIKTCFCVKKPKVIYEHERI